ncbi:MAG: prenyltransferase [Acidimicrobiales bacterium]
MNIATAPSRADLREAADSIAEVQRPDGQIPWFPGGHADPWNHIEAAMALDVAGLVDEAVAAYEWLVATQRPDGSWHQYYRGAEVEEPLLDTNVTAYVATGVWHHFLATGDGAFLATHYPMVAGAMDFVTALQRIDGAVVWARHSDGTPWSFALLAASSSTRFSLACAAWTAEALGLRADAARWAEAARRLAGAIAHRPAAFTPKDRFAMDWYYPVLAGGLKGEAARMRLAAGWDRFVMEGLGVRCVADRPWVTAAETAECALAHAAAGEIDRARELWWAGQHLRLRDGAAGAYLTGLVHPEQRSFPTDETATYGAAAMILAADGIWGRTPASRLFVAQGGRSP